MEEKADNRNARPTGSRFPKVGPTKTVLVILSVIIVVLGAYGFAVRFFEFFETLRLDANGKFTIVPMLNYLGVGAGLLCLFGWALLRGMFRDIERPKYTMLENEEKLDQGIIPGGSE